MFDRERSRQVTFMWIDIWGQQTEAYLQVERERKSRRKRFQKACRRAFRRLEIRLESVCLDFKERFG